MFCKQNLFFLLILALPLYASPCDWMDKAIEKEFSYWEENGISKELLEKSWAHFQKNGATARYQVIDSKVYGPNTNIKALLEEIVLNYPLPDIDILYYHQDKVHEWLLPEETNAPIFASAKTASQNRVVLFIDWYYHTHDSKHGWNHLVKEIDTAQDQCPWDQKKDILFWRGANTDGRYDRVSFRRLPRGFLVYSSLKYPNLIDAAFTKYVDFLTKDPLWLEKTLPVSPFVEVVQHLPFKYQIILDGITCTYPGTQWRLLSGCLCFKQESDEIMWFSNQLIPWMHYVPVQRDLSDLILKIQWAKSHDIQTREIAQNARTFAQTHLLKEHILLYCYKALCKYSSLQNFTPKAPDK